MLFPLQALFLLGALQYTEWIGKAKGMTVVVLFVGASFFWPTWKEQRSFFSRDYPKSWIDIVPQISDHFEGEVPLDCSQQDLFIAQLSAHREKGWPLLPDRSFCNSQFEKRERALILSSYKTGLPGWTLLGVWSLDKGEVYLYRSTKR